jgi:glycosyltransferase involved in cell wall biosynthesis
MPFFSIVTPLYNKQELIACTIESALAQTFTDFELIIIDDGSTDNSAEVVKGFTDPRIVYHKTENRKVSAARNTGIEMAKGEVIAFLDADDHWEPNHLERLQSLYNDHPSAGLLASRYIIKIGNGKIINPVFLNLPTDYKGIVPDPFETSLINRLTVTSAVAVPKHVFEVTGMFDVNVTHPEDTEMWIKIMLKFPTVVTDTVTMVYNFDLPESWSRKKMKGRKLMDFTQFLKEEAVNKSLKSYIDIYRIEYALKFRIEGDIEKSQELYNTAAPENISSKTKFLFLLPPLVLRIMLRFKHWLHKKGVALSAYN